MQKPLWQRFSLRVFIIHSAYRLYTAWYQFLFNRWETKREMVQGFGRFLIPVLPYPCRGPSFLVFGKKGSKEADWGGVELLGKL